MSPLDQPDQNTLRAAEKGAQLAQAAATNQGLPRDQVEAAKATAIGTIVGMRTVSKG